MGSCLLQQLGLYLLHHSFPDDGVSVSSMYFANIFSHRVGGRLCACVHLHHQKKGSHFINEISRMMGLCCFSILFIFFIHLLMFGDSYPHSLPPSQLLVVSHVAVMLLFTTGCLTLIFALPWLSVLCWLLFTSCLSPPSSLLHCLCLTCNDLFHAFLIFILTPLLPRLPFLSSPRPSPSPLLSLLFFNACDVCIGLLWCDQSSTPKFARKIKTPAHSKNLHHDWLLPPGDDLPCPLPPPVCAPPGLSCPALP